MADYDTFQRAAIRGQDKIVSCPYNPSHQINQSRMQYHLVKCKKQQLQSEFEICPYNASHRIPKPIYQCHIKECPDKKILESHKYQSVDETTNNVSKQSEYQPPTLPPSEENWDDEDMTSYQPEKYVSKKPVLRNLQGATKAERKKFRMEERRRVIQLSTEEPESTYFSAGDISLRLPRTLPIAMKTSEVSSRLGMGRGVPCNENESKEIDFQVRGRGRGILYQC